MIYTSIVSGFIYYSISSYSFKDFYKRLEIRAAVAAKVKLEKTANNQSVKDVGSEYLEKLPNQQEYYITLKGNNALDILPENIPQDFFDKIVKDGNGTYSHKNIFYSGIVYTANNQMRYVVIVSAENYFYSHHIAYLRNLLLGSLLFGVLWIIVFATIMSRTLTKPIKNIINEVDKIGTENLHLRLETPKANDSLSELIKTFNGMLTRLETSFETQKNFISNASHELNTPLTSIIGEADLALSKQREPEEYRTALKIILDEADKLSKKTKALLFLAQTGFNGKSQKFDEVRIDQLVLDVRENIQKINANNRIKFDFSLLPENPDLLKVMGNEQLLHLALSNIIINACKYSNNEVVNVALGATDNQCIIIVKDSGIGIPEEDMSYIYDPYFRASNTGGYEGYGIGLPLTRNIVRMHNGILIVQSELNKGTTVQIKIPVAE